MRLIDADALLAAMYHEAFENDASYDEKNPLAKWDSGLWVRYKMFERCLESAPSIDAVKHGRWEEKEVIHYGQTIEEWQSAKCSVCGRYHTTPFTYYFKYCPNCGARMDEGDNHETN